MSPFCPFRTVIDDPFIRLLQDGRTVFEEDFTPSLAGLDKAQRMDWLGERALLLADEFRDGAFDTNGELDPWEPE